jgi:hypothetical protein
VGVSSGNNYDSGNGFILEQSQWNNGINIGVWQRQNQALEQELNACRHFYENSYPVFPLGSTTAYASSGFGLQSTPCTIGYAVAGTSGSTAVNSAFFSFKVQKRYTNTTSSNVGIYSPTNGSGSGAFDILNNGGTLTTASGNSLLIGDKSTDYGFYIIYSSVPATSCGVAFNWSVDARI